MPCAEFETLLLDYPELNASSRAIADAHASVCPGCSAFLAALVEADRALTAEFSGAPAELRAAVRVRLERPSPLPEILDFVGWSGLIAAAAMLIMFFAPPSQWK